MVVDVSYQAPAGKAASKEFTIRSESGSKLLIERVFKKVLQSEKESVAEENQRGVALNHDNYNFSFVGREKTPTGFVYILSVEPRTQNKLLYRGRIWVDATDFAVMRIEAEPAKNPSFWTKETQIEQIYSKVGDFWLPRSNRSTTTVRWAAMLPSPSTTASTGSLRSPRRVRQETTWRGFDNAEGRLRARAFTP